MKLPPKATQHFAGNAPGFETARFWFATVLSLLFHVLLVLLMGHVSTHHPAATNDRPLAVDACAIAQEEPVAALKIESSQPAPLAPIVPTVALPLPAPASTTPAMTPIFSQSGDVSAVTTGPSQGANPAMGASGEGVVTTVFFQTTVRAKKIVYVLDRSSSMGLNGALDKIKLELLQSLDCLPADARFQVVLYNRHAETLTIPGQTGLASATQANKRQTASRLQAIIPEGGTNHLEALQLALSLQPDVIFFLTDADDLKPEQVAAVTRINQGRAAIHTIELTTANLGRDDMPLHVLARSNRGQYRAVALEQR